MNGGSVGNHVERRKHVSSAHLLTCKKQGALFVKSQHNMAESTAFAEYYVIAYLKISLSSFSKAMRPIPDPNFIFVRPMPKPHHVHHFATTLFIFGRPVFILVEAICSSHVQAAEQMSAVSPGTWCSSFSSLLAPHHPL